MLNLASPNWFARFMGVSFGNSGDISWKISIPNFCKKDCKGQRNRIRLAYDAFSVAKVSYEATKNFPLENMHIILWNTRHRIYVRKTVT